MSEGVQADLAESVKEDKPQSTMSDNARENFRRLEEAKEAERERRVQAEQESALLKQRLEMLEQRNQPKEVDPLDEDEDYDPKRLKAALDQRERRFKKEAEEIATRKFEEYKNKEQKQNHMSRLKSENHDYDSVMTTENIVALEKANPEFVQSLMRISDDYERKKLAYNYLKRTQAVSKAPSIKEKVEENSKNPYHIPAGSGVPAAVDFDLKSPQARQAAYAKLKAAQRQPIGGGRN